VNLDTARIFVRDLVAARRFYAEALDLRLVADGMAQGYCVFKAGATALVVEAVGPEAPADDQALVGRFTGLSFSTPDIAALHQALQARGVVFCEAPERQPWGGIVATLLDPAGNALQLAQHPA
jgi:predicted enzyme related to lactoylglutathione lyase